MIATQKNIINLVSWIANVPSTQVQASTDIREDLSLDSIDFMLFIVRLENFFNINFSNEEVEAIETVKDATDYVNRHVVSYS